MTSESPLGPARVPLSDVHRIDFRLPDRHGFYSRERDHMLEAGEGFHAQGIPTYYTENQSVEQPTLSPAEFGPPKYSNRVVSVPHADAEKRGLHRKLEY